MPNIFEHKGLIESSCRDNDKSSLEHSCSVIITQKSEHDSMSYDVKKNENDNNNKITIIIK